MTCQEENAASLKDFADELRDKVYALAAAVDKTPEFTRLAARLAGRVEWATCLAGRLADEAAQFIGAHPEEGSEAAIEAIDRDVERLRKAKLDAFRNPTRELFA